MKCPKCNSTKTIKNGHRRGKQCYRCHICGRQFVEFPKNQPYSPQVKQLSLKMYVNGMGLRGIERVTGIHHTTILNWIREAGLSLSDVPQEDEIPEITEIDELQTPTHPEGLPGGMRGAFRTFVGQKKNKLWVWTVVNHWKPGIILWTVGDRSSLSFETLWLTIKCWHSFWSPVLRRLTAEPAATAKRYVTDGWKVYPNFIESEDHLVCKTYMTRVEVVVHLVRVQGACDDPKGRKYSTETLLSSPTLSLYPPSNGGWSLSTAGEDAALLHRKTLCYSKSLQMLKLSIRLLLHYLKFQTIPASA